MTITPLSDDDSVATVSPTSLRFTAENWSTSQTVTVKGVEDDVSNDPARSTAITHAIRGGGYGDVRINPVVVTLIDDDGTPSQQLDDVILPKVMAQVSGATTTAITRRLDGIAAGEGASPVPLEDLASNAVQFLRSQEAALNGGDLQWEETLAGRHFALPLPLPSLSLAATAEDNEETVASAPGPVVLWGSGDYISYGDRIDGIDFEGTTFSAHLGFDLQPRADLVTGVALALSDSRLDYDYTDMTKSGSGGTYKVKITSVNPYVGYTASEQLRLWASLGYGRGERQIQQKGEAVITDQGAWWSLLAGARFELWSADAPMGGGSAPPSLAMKVDGGAAQFLDVTVQQARLAAEASRRFAVASGELTTAIELGLRLRSEEAAGVELGGRLHWQDMARGLSTTVNGRLLLAGGDAHEWGVGGNISYEPGDNGKGLRIVLEPSVGDTSSTLMDLWSLGDVGVSLSSAVPGAALRAALGYGFPIGSGLVTPYSDVSLSEGGRSTFGLGLHYDWPSWLDLDLKAEQQRSSNGSVDHRVDLQLHTPL